MHGFSAGPSIRIDHAGVTLSLWDPLAPPRSAARPEVSIFVGNARNRRAVVSDDRSVQADE
ncbi:hypothetical protein BDD21_4478 [Thiocapsa rosea]|uniref:Uncharacterized protein n=1 Tax=Thiocapsa rosea TaxID=69360 RepID=A0A495VCE4_9GAMM|nr:hypothetical protein BDD21_4478 [Thiocapsa rosea]